MKKYFVLSIVFIALCLGLSSCVVNVHDDHHEHYGHILVKYRLAPDIEPGWEVIEKTTIIDDDEDERYDYYDGNIWDDESGKCCGYDFLVSPGRYHVRINVYNSFTRRDYVFKTKSKKVRDGETLTAIYDGHNFYFD